MAISEAQLEKRLIVTGTIFILSLFAVATLSIDLFGIGLPTCITDIKPFAKSDVLFHSPTHFEIHWVASMWKFDPTELTIPAGTDLDIYLSAKDVTHGFQIVGTNVNLLAVPGVVNYAHVKINEPGDYTVVCHEYCGTGHQNMSTVIHVTNPLQPQTAPSPQPSLSLAQLGHPGYKVLEGRACLACHTVNGTTGTGPTFRGLYGTQVELADGSKVKADDAYIRESIRTPMAKVVKGFTPVMPVIPLSDHEIDQVVDYLKAIK